MKVKRLIEHLEKLDGEADVVLDLLDGPHNIDDEYSYPCSGGNGVVWISVGDGIDYARPNSDLIT